MPLQPARDGASPDARRLAGAKAAIDDADLNGDGVIDYAEFRHALSSARRKSGDRLAPPVS